MEEPEAITPRSFDRLAGPRSAMKAITLKSFNDLARPRLISSLEQFHRLGEPGSAVKPIKLKSFADLGGPGSVADAIKLKSFADLGGPGSVADAIKLKSFADLGGPGSMADAIKLRVDPLVGLSAMLERAAAPDYDLANVGLVDVVSNVEDWSRLQGPLSGGTPLPTRHELVRPRPPTLLLVVMALAVTNAGLADTVLENALALGRLGVGGLEWLSEQLPDPTAIVWAQYLKAILLAGKDDSGKE